MDDFKVGVYQGSSCPFGIIENNVETIIQQASKASELGVKLLMFPELFLNGYDTPIQHLHATAIDISHPSPIIDKFKSIAINYKIALCIPYAERVSIIGSSLPQSSRQFRDPGLSDQNDYAIFNSALLIDQWYGYLSNDYYFFTNLI